MVYSVQENRPIVRRRSAVVKQITTKRAETHVPGQAKEERQERLDNTFFVVTLEA